MNYKTFANDVKAGENILLDDGKLIFKIIETDGVSEVRAQVIQGGPLRSKKGVNLPNTNVSLPALTEKDIKDAQFAIQLNVDWIALSFVRTSHDLQDLTVLIITHAADKIPVNAKLDKPEAVKNIDDLIRHCDG